MKYRRLSRITDSRNRRSLRSSSRITDSRRYHRSRVRDNQAESLPRRMARSSWKEQNDRLLGEFESRFPSLKNALVAKWLTMDTVQFGPDAPTFERAYTKPLPLPFDETVWGDGPEPHPLDEYLDAQRDYEREVREIEWHNEVVEESDIGWIMTDWNDTGDIYSVNFSHLWPNIWGPMSEDAKTIDEVIEGAQFLLSQPRWNFS